MRELEDGRVVLGHLVLAHRRGPQRAAIGTALPTAVAAALDALLCVGPLGVELGKGLVVVVELQVVEVYDVIHRLLHEGHVVAHQQHGGALERL